MAAWCGKPFPVYTARQNRPSPPRHPGEKSPPVASRLRLPVGGSGRAHPWAPLFPQVDRTQCMDVAQSNLSATPEYTSGVCRGYTTERTESPRTKRFQSFSALRPYPGISRGRIPGPLHQSTIIDHERSSPLSSLLSLDTTRWNQTVSLLPCRASARSRDSYLRPAPLLWRDIRLTGRPTGYQPVGHRSSQVSSDLRLTDHVARRCYPPRLARHVPHSHGATIATASCRPFGG